MALRDSGSSGTAPAVAGGWGARQPSARLLLVVDNAEDALQEGPDASHGHGATVLHNLLQVSQRRPALLTRGAGSRWWWPPEHQQQPTDSLLFLDGCTAGVPVLVRRARAHAG